MTIQERSQTAPTPPAAPESAPLIAMTSKELIQTELDLMSEEQLGEVYRLVQAFLDTQPLREGATFMEKMRRIKIDAPADFSTNWERYLGEAEDA
ncbi:MAG: hypothetical protein M3Z04_07550 [Chloroflexota bacterium]|nr:hypothetical protein [Chloroflexota bacterium]